MTKNIIRIALIVKLIGIILPIYSQTQPDNLKITSERIIRDGDQVSVAMDFILDEMNIKSNDMLILTPTLKSNGFNGEILSLPPIVIAGKVRSKIVSRKEKLKNQDQLLFENKPHTMLKRKNNTPQSVNYGVSISYKPWMNDASLTIKKNILGCASCNNDAGDQLILQNILPKPEPTSYKLTYITPKADPIIGRSNRHTATFNYHVDSYELLKDCKSNNFEFAQIEKIIEEIRDHKYFEITEFTIVGYTSPEGRFEHNRILAEKRASSIANYLITKLGISNDKFTVEGKGEDWAGLRKAISDSFLTDRLDILNIIDKIQNPDNRDRWLIKLSKGDTYKTLLNDYYPKLRRAEYTIAYIVHPFDLEEARQIINTNPKQLSLNEIYLIAQSYSSNSKEFKDIFNIAVQLYPDCEIAIVNSAASDIENKNYDQAIEHLKKIEDNPISWNNLGVAYALKNDLQKASEYFKKSKSLNNAEAEANLKIIQE